MEVKNSSKEGKIYLVVGTILILAAIAFTLLSIIDVTEEIYQYITYESPKASQSSGDGIILIRNSIRPHLGHTIFRGALSLVILIGTVFFGVKFYRKKEYGKYLITGLLGALGWFLLNLAFFFLRISGMAAKPVIYLYPETMQDIYVDLDINNPDDSFTTIYPQFSDVENHSWSVVADPDGTIYLDDREYSYLFRESTDTNSYDLSQGFVIHRDDAVEFLQESLSTLGLTPVEYNEMIVYRLPFIEQSPYSLIHFATPEEYDRRYPLTITPEPDSMLRIFMVIKPLRHEIDGIIPQKLETFERKGFSVVEWGGSYLK